MNQFATKFSPEEQTVKDGAFPRTPCTVCLNKPPRRLGSFDGLISLRVQTPVI